MCGALPARTPLRPTEALSPQMCCFQSFLEEVFTGAEDGCFDFPGHILLQARLARGVLVHPGQASARELSAREAVRMALCGSSGLSARRGQFVCQSS